MSYELLPKRDQTPTWLLAIGTANEIIDRCSSAILHPGPLQSVCLAHINIAAFMNVLAKSLMPLSGEAKEEYKWLGEVSEFCGTRIYGSIGLSPSLVLHFAHITQLSAMIASALSKAPKDQKSQENSIAALKECIPHLLEPLDELEQVSYHPQQASLIQHVGHMWKLAVQLYAQCRLCRFVSIKG